MSYLLEGSALLPLRPCHRVMCCLGTIVLKPTGSRRRASSLYTERRRLVHFPCAHFQFPSPSCASHLKCAHLAAGRANGEGGFARSYEQQLGVHRQRAPHQLEHRAHAVLVLPRAWCSRSPQRTSPRCCALATHLLQFPNFHFSPLIVFCRSAVVFKNSLFCATSDSITCLATTLVSLMP
jgi:hypothetical protein